MRRLDPEVLKSVIRLAIIQATTRGAGGSMVDQVFSKRGEDVIVGSRDFQLGVAKREAIERLSRRCPVIKKMNAVLDEGDYLDMQHAVDVLRVRLSGMPEAKATIDVLDRLIQIEEKGAPCR